MGQRGNRKGRYRCRYVDPHTGMRCRKQVKRAGSHHCDRRHANMAAGDRKRGQVPKMAAIGHRAIRKKARDAAEARIREALVMAGLAGHQLELALQVALEMRDEGYRRGYNAGHETARKTTRQLTLGMSKRLMESFVASKFGKSFIGGTLRPEQFADFRLTETR